MRADAVTLHTDCEGGASADTLCLRNAAGIAYPASFFTDRLTDGAIELLRAYRWPANALAALKCWVDPSSQAIFSGMALLEACLTGWCSEGERACW